MAATLILAFLCGATSSIDMDYHWHLALGRNLLREGFPSTEPFSFLPVGAPDRQAWLADAAFAVLDRIGGVALIRIVCGVVFATGALAVLRLSKRRAGSLALALVPVAVYFAFATSRLRLRPDLFSLALLPLFAELLDRAPSWRRAVVLFLVAALWANLHPGSLLAGFLALAQLWPPKPARILDVVATWGGLCVTPDGIRGLLRFTADTTPLRPLIPEWQRLWERPVAEFAGEWAVVIGLIVVCAGAAIIAVRAGPQAARQTATAPGDVDSSGSAARDLLRAFLGVALAASAVRFLFSLVLPALWAVSVLRPIVTPRPAARLLAFAAVVGALIAVPLPHLASTWRAVSIAGWDVLGAAPPQFPSGAADFLAASELSGNMAHPARWGGFLGSRLSPRFKTATDGRVTHFGAELAREWSVGIDSPARDEIFARRGVDFAVIPREMLSSFHDDHPYELLYTDPLSAVLLRLEGPNAPQNIAILKAAAKEKRRAQAR